MLPNSVGGSNRPFAATGLPDELSPDQIAFLQEVYAEQDHLSDEDLCYLAEREAELRMAVELASGGRKLPKVSIPFLPLTLTA